MTIWLKQSTAVTIKFGPFVDAGDGVTLETGLATALDNATTGVRVSKNGGNYADRNSATAPTYDEMGEYNVELSTTDTNTLGSLKIIFEEAATCLPVWQTFMVVPANVYDSLFGADNLQVDVTQFGGSAATTSAGRPEVNTTYVGGTIQTGNDNGADINNILDAVGQVNDAAADGDPSNTESIQQYVKQIINTLEGTAGIPTFPAEAAPGNAVSLAEAIRAIHADVSTDGVALSATATSAQLVDDIWDEALTPGDHNITDSGGQRLRELQESGGYGGFIWIDSAVGNTNTEDYTDGTDTNPVSTLAAAATLAASLNISRYKIAPGSTFTLTTGLTDTYVEGNDWTLALGSQSIDGSTFLGANVSGVGTNVSGTQRFISCVMGATTLPDDTTLTRCQLVGNQTLGAGDHWFDGCYSAVAGTGTPAVDFGVGTGNTNLSMRHYSGGIEVLNIGDTGTDNMSLEGEGQLVLNANCDGGTVAIRGHFTVTDNAGGAVTLSDDARIDITQINDQVVDVIDTDTSPELTGAPTATSSLRDRIAWLFLLARNKRTQTATTASVFNDAGDTAQSTATVSESGGTTTRGEWST